MKKLHQLRRKLGCLTYSQLLEVEKTVLQFEQDNATIAEKIKMSQGFNEDKYLSNLSGFWGGGHSHNEED